MREWGLRYISTGGGIAFFRMKMPIIDTYKLLLTQKVSQPRFLDEFSDDDECLELYFKLKFEGFKCVWCDRSVTENYVRIGRPDKNGTPKKAFRCKSCHRYIYPLSDSIFRRSPVKLSKIFWCAFVLVSSGGSTAATEISKLSGLSYKTSHKLMMLLRNLLGDINRDKMKGIVEIDEAFLGKGNKVYNWSAISTRKQPIIGFVERETKRVRIFLVSDRSASTIKNLVLNNVEVGSTVYTDSWKGYNCLSEFYQHEVVDHSKREYVRGKIHTNSIENVWSHFKRNIRKAHIKITDKYVQQYVNEACWRRNSRGQSSMILFSQILERSFFSLGD